MSLDTVDAIEYYAANPVEWVKDAIGVTPDPWQGDAMNDVNTYGFVAIRSGSGVGKSALMSWVTLHFLCNYPDSVVPSTAPSQHQLFDVLWGQHAYWINRSEILNQMLVWTQTKVAMKGHEAYWHAVARTARIKPGTEVSEGLQGFHGVVNNLCFVIDEAPGVEEPVMAAVAGALTGGQTRIIMSGNPSRLTGTFYNAFHKAAHMWKQYHINSEDSPRCSQRYIDYMRATYGKDSIVYAIKVTGEFPTGESDVLIPFQLIEDLFLFKPHVPGRKIVSFDVARMGADKTVMMIRDGNHIIQVETMAYGDEVQTFGWAKELLGASVNFDLDRIIIEAAGVGTGFKDMMAHEYGHDIVYGFVPGSGADDELVSKTEKFLNARAQAWWNLKLSVHSLYVVQDLPQLREELAHIRYGFTTAGDKIKIISKDELRGTSGLGRSPDYADALMISFAEDFCIEVPGNILYCNFGRNMANTNKEFKRASGWKGPFGHSAAHSLN